MNRKNVVELVGLTAIVASLVFLAIEIRQSNQIGRLEAMQAMGAEWGTIGIELASSDRLTELTTQVFSGAIPTDFEAADNTAIALVLLSLDHQWEMRYNQLQLDVLESGDFSYPMSTNRLFSSKYHRAMWPRIRPEFSEEFAVFWEQRFKLTEN